MSLSRAMLVAALVVVAWGATGEAADVFLKGANSSSVTSVLKPYVQGCASGGDSCSGCACWSTSMGMIFAYWDDNSYGGEGPWEELLPGGGMFDASAYEQGTQDLLDSTGMADCTGPTGTAEDFCGNGRSYSQNFTNAVRGYDFSYDVDEWVWFGLDIADEIDAGRPVYFAYYPEWVSPGEYYGHAIVLVGHDRTDENIWFYDTGDYSAHVRGYEENMHGEPTSIDCATATTPGGGPVCPAGQWQCADGACVNDSYRCDQDPDCEDGTDEAGCSPCSDSYFRCDSGDCVHVNGYCDYDNDCGDWSDEQGCGSCAYNQIRCPTGECTYDGADCVTCTPSTCSQLNKDCSSWPDGCGGYVNCGGCSGIDICNTNGQCVTPDCPGTEWRCDDGECINQAYRCDRDSDCADGSDEWECFPCDNYQFRCDNNECIPHWDHCDFQFDCEDGSDEQGCGLCNDNQFRCQNGSCESDLDDCLCTPLTCSQMARECGRWPDGCGGDVDCGSCSGGATCDSQGHCSSCPQGEAPCATGQCLGSAYFCNYISDCADGSDEWGCSPCGSSEFRCDSNRCVPTYYHCDYDDDCGDASDEQGCGACGVTQYRCSNNTCVGDWNACHPDPVCEDRDGDDYKDASCGGKDCNDSDASVFPGAPEPCDGKDNDCDGFTDEDGGCSCPDRDLDSHTDAACGGSDCDDGNASIHPGAAETCDGRDNNCNGQTDEGDVCSSCADNDGDGAPSAHCGGTDCDDFDASRHPGAAEACDRVDNDCDGMTDEGHACPTLDEVDPGCGCAGSPGRPGATAGLGFLGVLGLLIRRVSSAA